jgi:hypothetical protein
VQRASQDSRIADLFSPTLYCLTPVLNAPSVSSLGVKLRWLFHLSRFLILPRATDSPVSAAPTPSRQHVGIGLTQQNGAVRVWQDGGECVATSSCVEPWSQLMNCLRCHGLMVTVRLEDRGGSSLAFSGWQCLMCGEVIDSVISANRKELHGLTRSRSRTRYGVSLG